MLDILAFTLYCAFMALFGIGSVYLQAVRYSVLPENSEHQNQQQP